MTNKKPFVVIIILNWNNYRATSKCLMSVNSLHYPYYLPIIVDNNSTDDSIKFLQKDHPSLKIIKNVENLGYTGGNNIGIKYALGLKADYILILNNDTILPPDLLEKLVLFAESSDSIGMVGPTILFNEPKDQIFAAGSCVDWEKGELIHRGIYKSVNHNPHLLKTMQVDFLVGCCILVKTSLINQMGLLNNIYFLNFEDVEWGIRARRYGYEVWHLSEAHLYHDVSSTLGIASPENTYYMTRNALYFFYHNSPDIYRVTTPIWIITRTLRTIAAWTFYKKYHSDTFRKKRAANIYAIRDFLRRRFGKMGPEVFSILTRN